MRLRLRISRVPSKALWPGRWKPLVVQAGGDAVDRRVPARATTSHHRSEGQRRMSRNTKHKPKTRWEQPVPQRRDGRRLALVVVVLGLAATAVSWISHRSEPPEQATLPPRQEPAPAPVEKIPPFFESQDAAKPLALTLSPASFNSPRVARAYRAAREIPEVLAQQPCYCHCDKFGHRGLLDCYRNDHGAG